MSRTTFKGGLRQKNPEISSFQAVMNMLNTPGAQITLVSYTSISGFVFKLEILKDNPEKVEFYGVNERTHALTVPIHCLIIKFALISWIDSLPDIQITGDTKGYSKECVELSKYKIEAKSQQDIFIKTLSPSGNPICPAIVDFSHFDKESAKIFLNKCKALITTGTKAEEVFNYIIRVITTKNYTNLGMITMEIADDYIELSKIPNTTADEQKIKDKMMIYSIAQIIILFVKLKIINYDAHTGNILANETKQKTTLIDFGRIVDFSDTPIRLSDLFTKYGTQIIQKYETITGTKFDDDLDELRKIKITDLFYYDDNKPTTQQKNKTIIETINKLLKFIAFVDYSTNAIYFPDYFRTVNKNRPQIHSLLKYVYGEPNIGSQWNQVPPNFILDDASNDKLKSVSITIKELCTDRIQSRNSNSNVSILKGKRGNKLFHVDVSIKNLYNRSQGCKDIEREQREREQMEREQREREQRERDQREREQEQQNNRIMIGKAAIFSTVAMLIGYVLYNFNKEEQNGGGSTMKSSNVVLKNNKQKHIIRIVIKLIKEYNCGIEIDVNDVNDKIKPIDKKHFDEYIKKHADMIEYVAEPEETCDLHKIKIPHINYLMSHIEKQLEINKQIKRRKTRKTTESK
jgi:hypothetical protein